MKVKTRLKSLHGTQDLVLDFEGRVPAKGELIHADEHGEGINAVVEEVIWLHFDGSMCQYYPWLIARTYDQPEAAAERAPGSQDGN